MGQNPLTSLQLVSVLDTGLTIILVLDSMLKWVNLLKVLTENSFKKGSKMCDGENTQMTNEIFFMMIWCMFCEKGRSFQSIQVSCLSGEREREWERERERDYYNVPAKGKPRCFQTKSILNQ